MRVSQLSQTQPQGATKARRRFGLPLVLAVAAGLLLGGCSDAGPSQGSYPLDWFTEMHYNQSYKIQEPPSISAPSESVPTTAGQGADYIVDLTVPLALDVNYTIDQARELENPLPRNEKFLVQGENLFQVNCAVCHGADGLGDGPMREKLAETEYPAAPADLTATGPTVNKPEGEIYLIITKGFAGAYGIPEELFVMPPFGKLLSPEERWSMVHYLLSLQGK